MSSWPWLILVRNVFVLYQGYSLPSSLCCLLWWAGESNIGHMGLLDMSLQNLSHDGDAFGDEDRRCELLGKSLSVNLSSFSPTFPCKSPLSYDFSCCSLHLMLNFNITNSFLDFKTFWWTPVMTHSATSSQKRCGGKSRCRCRWRPRCRARAPCSPSRRTATLWNPCPSRVRMAKELPDVPQQPDPVIKSDGFGFFFILSWPGEEEGKEEAQTDRGSGQAAERRWNQGTDVGFLGPCGHLGPGAPHAAAHAVEGERRSPQAVCSALLLPHRSAADRGKHLQLTSVNKRAAARF